MLITTYALCDNEGALLTFGAPLASGAIEKPTILLRCIKLFLAPLDVMALNA